MTTLKELAKRCRIATKYGASLPWDRQDEWQRNSNSYRCTLRYRGRQYSFDFFMGAAIRGEPTAEDTLGCLLSDATADPDFESFCREFGYDTDSRKAEKIHTSCLKTREALERLLGDDFEAFMAANR